jgi:hypothetical protein
MPSLLLDESIAHVDASLGRMVETLKVNQLHDSTLFVLGIHEADNVTWVRSSEGLRQGLRQPLKTRA